MNPERQIPSRLTISLRLKAARLLHGETSPKGHAVGLPVRDLVQRPALARQRVSKDRVESFEQMKGSEPRPWELDVLAEALGVDPVWFWVEDLVPMLGELLDPREATARAVEDAAASHERPTDSSEADRSDRSPGGPGR